MVVVFKKILIVIALICLMTVQVQAAGLTLWSVAEKIVEVDESASIAGRLGYYFGSDNGGLEIFAGSTWHPESKSPQVLSIGVIEHLPDLIDPNNPLPWIPNILLTFINEDVEVRPYAGLEGTFNFIEENVGYYGGVVGVLAKLTPNSRIQYGLEGSYKEGFGELEGLNKTQLSFVIRIPF